MQLSCRGCSKPIPAEDVNIKLAIAKCSTCNAVFSFADSLGADARQPAIAARPTVPTPKGYTVENWSNDLIISRRWFTAAVLFLVFFGVICCLSRVIESP
jgi:hypothetical protein